MMDDHLEQLMSKGMNQQQILEHLMGGLKPGENDSELKAKDINVNDDVLNQFENLMDEMKGKEEFNQEFKEFSK